MVYYCSVKGCKNNSKMKKKDPNIILSFHAFPVKETTKLKWLRAIGRPSWKPPSFARICSTHFDVAQISHEGCRIRMMEDACPVNGLPPNSNFEASDVEVCRICLGTDMKMFSLQEGLLNTCLQSFAGLKENCSIDGLPQFVCYECSTRLINCYNLIEQSCIAQSVLLDLFTKNGQVTKSLVKSQDRRALGLESSLQCCNTTDLHQYIFNENSENTNSEDINTLYKLDECTDTTESSVNKQQLKIIIDTETEISKRDDSDELNKSLTIACNDKIAEARKTVSYDHEYAVKEENTGDVLNYSSDESEMDVVLTEDDDEKVKGKLKKQRNAVKTSGFTPTEKDLLQYFTIATLTRKQQKQQWEYVVRSVRDGRWECEECDRQFATNTAYTNHKAGHDPSRGEVKCPVCFLRYKTDTLMQAHVRKYHEKIFYCKSCPSSFYNAKSAKSHHLTHTEHTYNCSRCAFVSRHASALGAHVRSAHEHALACALCGRPVTSERGMKMHLAMAHRDLDKTNGTDSLKYPCQECHIHFVSEEARRVHLLTSKQHRKIPDLCDPVTSNQDMKTACSKCGSQFPTMRELVAHTRAEHPRQKRGSQINEGYPAKCDHCEEMLSNRCQHWQHVRRQHPEDKHSYRARHNCVCPRCGKQFQNSTKLRAHELRHGPARLPCPAPACARTFHHKYALARHAATHERPAHACDLCARAFNNKHNLARHQRVHTGETPYACNLCDKRFKHSTSLALHVRSVHCNLPPPKRSKLTIESDS